MPTSHKPSSPAIRPTPEQETIIGTKWNPGQCALINAYAGTGKTTTLEMLARANPGKRILYLCFNREAAMQAKATFPKHADCRTIHSLAFASHGPAYRHKLGTLRPLEVMRALNLSTPSDAVYVIETVDRYLHSVDSEIQGYHLPAEVELYAIDADRVVDGARRLWHLMQDRQSAVPMSHDGYLKLWAMGSPRLACYDMLLLDEAQDTNPVSLDVVLGQRAFGRTSLIFVGDTHQSIYRWRFAINAMEQLKQVASVSLPLTTSFRFGGDIAEEASLFLNFWKNDFVTLVGKGPSPRPAGGSAVIARTNAELLGAAIPLASRGDKIHFAGTTERDGWDPYVPYSLQIPLDLLSLRSGQKDLIETCYIKGFESFQEAVQHAHGDENGRGADIELAKHISLVEEYGELLPSIIDTVRRHSCSEREASMSFSTAHRAKGREWRQVRLLPDFLKIGDVPLHQLGSLRLDPDFREELNLVYVAMTRACESNSYPSDIRDWLNQQKGKSLGTASGSPSLQHEPLSMKNTSWIIVDTETDGLHDPIHVLEIAAQRMNGWEPVGEKFRVLLNHRVPIPPEATAVHGYTTEFLSQHGEDPHQAHARFREYAKGDPIVAHNLSFDWNRALFQEWLRLGLEPAGQRGFCTLMLSRRLVDECTSYRLDALRETFQITSRNSHRAFGDVEALVELFNRVFRPRLEASRLDTFDAVVEFSKRTPVAKCLCQVKAPREVSEQPPLPTAGREDCWYYIDPMNESHGPLSAREIQNRMGSIPCWVWREGLPDWVTSVGCDDFILSVNSPLPASPTPQKPQPISGRGSVQELIALCRGLVADAKITSAEVKFLSKWLEDAGLITEWPATEIAQTIERITADGKVAKEEKAELLRLLQRVCS